MTGGAARHTVLATDGATLQDVLARLGPIAASAARDGRAFVNGRRARDGHPIAAGDEVVVHAPRPALDRPCEILFDRGGLVVADKPVGLATTADRRGDASLLDDVATALGVPLTTVHAASRLDVGVSGVVLLSTTVASTQLVTHAKERGEIARTYVAIAAGKLLGDGLWDAPIGVSRTGGGRALPGIGGRGARPAQTRWRALASARDATLLLLEPVTGRSHQLRVHAAHARAPLFGDREHRGPARLVRDDGSVIALRRVALHALRVVFFPHVDVTVPPPPDLLALWRDLGGDDAAWP